MDTQAIIKAFVLAIKEGRMTLEEIPQEYQAEVQSLLEG